MAGKDIYDALKASDIHQPPPVRTTPPPVPAQAQALTQIAAQTRETALWMKRIFWLLVVALVVFPVIGGISVAVWNSIQAKKLTDAGQALPLGGNDKAMQDVLQNADTLLRRAMGGK